MADTVPQIRVRADTESHDVSSRAETLARLNLKGVPLSALDETGGILLDLQYDTVYFQSIHANTKSVAHAVPNGKPHSSKSVPSFPGNSGNPVHNTPKSTSLEGRKDSQAIDPLSHVRPR